MLCVTRVSALEDDNADRRDIVPLGSKRGKFNYNLDEKRVLNFENVVNDDDNIKQDMSIDVYGRKNEDDDDQPQNGAAEVRRPAFQNKTCYVRQCRSASEHGCIRDHASLDAGSASREAGGRGRCSRCAALWLMNTCRLWSWVVILSWQQQPACLLAMPHRMRAGNGCGR